MLKTFFKKLDQPIDISSLVYFRIGFGLIMLWEISRYFYNGWITDLYAKPPFHFKYPGFEWIVVPNDELLYLLFSLLGVLSIMIILGLFYRLAAVLFFFGFTYFYLMDAAYYLNHLYLACLISCMVIWMPLNGNFSMDSKFFPKIRTGFAPFWCLALLRFQMGVVYFYGGIAKIESDWLTGKPMSIWLSHRVHFPMVGPYFADPVFQKYLAIIYSWSGMILDLFIPFALLWKKTRWYAFALITIFHTHNHFFFTIGIFPFFATLLSSLFFEPDFPKKILSWFNLTFQGRPVTGSNGAVFQQSISSKWIHYGICAYIIFQLLMPLRHWTMPGWVSWNEMGHRYSWRMMLRNKEARMTFFLTNPATNETRHAHASDYLHPKQVHTLQYKPEMMISFAHYLKNLVIKDAGFDPIVRVAAELSLNGRPHQPYTKPNLDVGKMNHQNVYELIIPLKEAL